MDKSALVLGGGSHYAIAWQLGYLKGMSDGGIELRDVKEVVGTSAGAQVGALITSELHWNTIWQEQIEQPIKEVAPLGDEAVAQLTQRFEQIAQSAQSDTDWVDALSTVSLETQTDYTQQERMAMIKQRLGSAKCDVWPKALNIVTTELETNARRMFSYQDQTNLIEALTASSAFQGVWPPVEIEGKHYYDGIAFSEENADLVNDANIVVILAPDLPMRTPYALDDLVEKMKARGQHICIVTPNEQVKKILKDFKDNALNPELRTQIAEAAKQQGYNDVDEMYQFWSRYE